MNRITPRIAAMALWLVCQLLLRGLDASAQVEKPGKAKKQPVPTNATQRRTCCCRCRESMLRDSFHVLMQKVVAIEKKTVLKETEKKADLTPCPIYKEIEHPPVVVNTNCYSCDSVRNTGSTQSLPNTASPSKAPPRPPIVTPSMKLPRKDSVLRLLSVKREGTNIFPKKGTVSEFEFPLLPEEKMELVVSGFKAISKVNGYAPEKVKLVLAGRILHSILLEIDDSTRSSTHNTAILRFVVQPESYAQEANLGYTMDDPYTVLRLPRQFMVRGKPLGLAYDNRVLGFRNPVEVRLISNDGWVWLPLLGVFILISLLLVYFSVHFIVNYKKHSEYLEWVKTSGNIAKKDIWKEKWRYRFESFITNPIEDIGSNKIARAQFIFWALIITISFVLIKLRTGFTVQLDSSIITLLGITTTTAWGEQLFDFIKKNYALLILSISSTQVQSRPQFRTLMNSLETEERKPTIGYEIVSVFVILWHMIMMFYFVGHVYSNFNFPHLEDAWLTLLGLNNLAYLTLKPKS